jgi:hypothetical protein
MLSLYTMWLGAVEACCPHFDSRLNPNHARNNVVQKEALVVWIPIPRLCCEGPLPQVTHLSVRISRRRAETPRKPLFEPLDGDHSDHVVNFVQREGWDTYAAPVIVHIGRRLQYILKELNPRPSRKPTARGNEHVTHYCRTVQQCGICCARSSKGGLNLVASCYQQQNALRMLEPG